LELIFIQTPQKVIFILRKCILKQDILVEVINISREIVIKMKLDKLKTPIDLSNHGKGLYFNQFESLGEKIARKIIVE